MHADGGRDRRPGAHRAQAEEEVLLRVHRLRGGRQAQGGEGPLQGGQGEIGEGLEGVLREVQCQAQARLPLLLLLLPYPLRAVLPPQQPLLVPSHQLPQPQHLPTTLPATLPTMGVWLWLLL